MNRRRLGFVLIGAGVVIALLVGLLVFLQVRDAEALRTAQPKRYVAVAATDIEERTVIAPNQVIILQVPEGAVPTGTASFLPPDNAPADQVERGRTELLSRVNGQFTPQRIFRGEIINTQRLEVSAGKNTPSYDLQPGKVAFPFPVKLAGGQPAHERVLVGFLNAVRPGDFVDIYYTSTEIPQNLTREQEDRARGVDAHMFIFTRRVFQNLRVINVGFFPDATGKVAETGKDERYLTLDVTPDEAIQLKWLKDVAILNGNIDMVLRSPRDNQPFPPATVRFEDMRRLYGIGSGN